MSDYVYNYIYGGVSGGIAAFVSHPAFRIKTACQNNEILNRNMYFNPRWLFTGVTRAMLGYSIEKMIIFGTVNTLKSHGANDTIAGFIAGLLASLTITPFEQLTIDKGNNIKCFNIKHLYKGLLPTAFRESLGFAVHFTVYGYLSDNFNKEKDWYKTIFCGVGAVLGGWGTITPLDRIKTRIQSGNNDKEAKLSVFKTIQRSYTGFHFALMRAIPFHVTCFLVIEYLNKNKNNI
jgi:hypothetical protein